MSEVIVITSGKGGVEMCIRDSQYIIGEERSFTIIAYPVPEIGEKFEEIFAETVKINTLDYTLYQNMQQKIIDVLDQAEKVHITGKNNNKTDLYVSIWPLKDATKESAFENCVADVNIPVGEVFTSPVLKGTTGKLFVSQVDVYKRQAYRRTASHCGASWKWIPKEREKSLFDRRRNRNTSNVTACKRVKL